MQLISLSFKQWKQVWENLKFSTFITKELPFSFFIVSLMLAMKQNSKPVDEVNAFINQIVKMSYDPIAVIKLAWLNQIHTFTPVSDSCWWGGLKLPESFPRPGPDCHRGQRRAEEEDHPEQVARRRGRGVVMVTCGIRYREYTHITKKNQRTLNTFAK